MRNILARVHRSGNPAREKTVGARGRSSSPPSFLFPFMDHRQDRSIGSVPTMCRQACPRRQVDPRRQGSCLRCHRRPPHAGLAEQLHQLAVKVGPLAIEAGELPGQPLPLFVDLSDVRRHRRDRRRLRRAARYLGIAVLCSSAGAIDPRRPDPRPRPPPQYPPPPYPPPAPRHRPSRPWPPGPPLPDRKPAPTPASSAAPAGSEHRPPKRPAPASALMDDC